jgi:hypothetical protein
MSLATGSDGCGDPVGELGILAAVRGVVLAQVGMVATATDIEGDTGFGEVHERMLVVKGLDEFEASASSWGTMAKAF